MQNMPNQSAGSPEGQEYSETEQSGMKPVQEIGFNQDVQNILLSRLQSVTPEEAAVLDKFISPETAPVLEKIFPELAELFQMLGKGGAGQQDIGVPSAGGGMQQQSQNPLVNPQNGVSRGLVG